MILHLAIIALESPIKMKVKIWPNKNLVEILDRIIQINPRRLPTEDVMYNK